MSLCKIDHVTVCLGVSQWQPVAVDVPLNRGIQSVMFAGIVNSNMQPGGIALDDIVYYSGCNGAGNEEPSLE